MALSTFPFSDSFYNGLLRVVANIFNIYIGRLKRRIFFLVLSLFPQKHNSTKTAVSHFKLWSKPIINVEWNARRNVNGTNVSKNKKLMESQTICTNGANKMEKTDTHRVWEYKKNANIYYFIHVWRAAANKLWQNSTGENITAAAALVQQEWRFFLSGENDANKK